MFLLPEHKGSSNEIASDTTTRNKNARWDCVFALRRGWSRANFSVLRSQNDHHVELRNRPCRKRIAEEGGLTAERPWEGFTLPRSAAGKSSLVAALPHHISVSAIHATFRADPARVKRFLPPGLNPVDEGYGWVMVGDLVKVPEADPELFWSDPQRTQYSECVVGFLASYQGRVGRYTALVWVDRDWSIGMGPIFGWGKRMAAVHRTRLPAANPAVRAMVSPTRWGGTVHRNGEPVVTLHVDTTNGTALTELPHFGDVSFLYRYIPSPGPGIPKVEQLLELGFSNVSTQNIRSGDGSLTFHSASQEELADLGEIDVVQGFTYDRGWTTSASAVLLEDRSADA